MTVLQDDTIGKYSVPLFVKEGLEEILLEIPRCPSLCSPPFSKGEVNAYKDVAQHDYQAIGYWQSNGKE